MTIQRTMIGWREWCALPELGIPAIQAKVDTGAATSSLHAIDIIPFELDGREWVSFVVHPIQGNKKFSVACTAPLLGQKNIISSNGAKERRYVIQTQLMIGTIAIDAAITLTSRHKMQFRMLLGREAIRKAKCIVYPGKSYMTGKLDDVRALYSLPPLKGL